MWIIARSSTNFYLKISKNWFSGFFENLIYAVKLTPLESYGYPFWVIISNILGNLTQYDWVMVNQYLGSNHFSLQIYTHGNSKVLQCTFVIFYIKRRSNNENLPYDLAPTQPTRPSNKVIVLYFSSIGSPSITINQTSFGV